MRQKEGRQQRLAEEREAFKRRKRNRSIKRWGVLLAIFAVALTIFWFLNRDDGDDSSNEAIETVTTADNTETSEPDADPTTTGTSTDPTGTSTDPTDTSTDPTDLESENPNTPTTQEEEIMPANYTTYTAADYGTTACPEEGSDRQLSFGDSFQNCLEPGTVYTAVMDTSLGTVRIELDTENTPGTSNNFISLSRARYYDDTLLHRTATDIGIIQGGSPHTNSASDPGPGYTIKDEGTGFTYRPGQIVMARTRGPDSSGAQFFFAVNSNTALLDSQGVYVVFGQVTEGLDVLEAVLASHKDIPSSGLGGAPDPDVTVRSVTIETAS